MPIVSGDFIYLSDQERTEAAARLRELDAEGDDLLAQARKHKRVDLEARVENGQRNLRDVVEKLESGEPIPISYAETMRSYFALAAMGERPENN